MGVSVKFTVAVFPPWMGTVATWARQLSSDATTVSGLWDCSIRSRLRPRPGAVYRVRQARDTQDGHGADVFSGSRRASALQSFPRPCGL
jgi:hypothetical protein